MLILGIATVTIAPIGKGYIKLTSIVSVEVPPATVGDPETSMLRSSTMENILRVWTSAGPSARVSTLVSKADPAFL